MLSTLAIFHLTANVISRARGQNAVAAAAYRLGATLRDERYGGVHNYSGKRGVVHAEIVAPSEAPQWTRDRQSLWNRVEASEARKDSQLARLIEVALPIELPAIEQIALVRDYVTAEFVALGMIADFCIRGTAHNPHAHILLTLRRATASGFGPKQRLWNGKAALLQWRAGWAERVNDYLARAGHATRIDHRTLHAQQSELTPVRRLGPAHGRSSDPQLPEHLAQRRVEQQRIARENGAILLEDPSVALRAMTRHEPTFNRSELERFLRTRTAGTEQFEAVLCAVMQSGELVALPAVAGPARYTSKDMLDAEKSLLRRAAAMAGRRGHGIPAAGRSSPLESDLSDLARRGLHYVLADGDAKALAVSDTDGAMILQAACCAWAQRGFAVRGAAASQSAVDGMRAGSSIEWRSVFDWEAEWQAGGELTRDTVLVVGAADLLALKALEQVLAAADRARALVLFVGAVDRVAARVDSPFQTLLRSTDAPAPSPSVSPHALNENNPGTAAEAAWALP